MTTASPPARQRHSPRRQAATLPASYTTTGDTTMEKDLELRRKDAELRFLESYRVLDSQYYRLLELCAEEPGACAWIRQTDVQSEDLPSELSDRRTLIYEYIVAIVEAAFVYKNLNKSFEHERWPLWDSFIRNYIKRKSFRLEVKSWLASGGFDMNKGFEMLMSAKIRGFEAKSET